jgi:D-alanyl-D-alanine carboxypeptidase
VTPRRPDVLLEEEGGGDGIDRPADDDGSTEAHDRDMNSTSIPTSRRRRAVRVVAATALAGLVLAAAACTSDDDAAGPPPSVAESTTAESTATARLATASSDPPPTTDPPASTVIRRPVPAGTTPTSTTPSSTTASSTAPSSTAPPSSTSPGPDPARQAALASILETHRAAGDFVGARVALRAPDGAVTTAESGTTAVDPASGPVDPDVPWNVGSVTKTFVAVVVLQLAEEGRLDLDAGIDRYLPALPSADRITPRQLLQHTSGLGEYKQQPAVLAEPTRQWTPAELIAIAEAGGRVGEPGATHRYSNTNYIVLGEIIEQVTGSPWDEEVRARIADPLGMAGTSLITNELPIGYQSIDGAFVETTSSADPSIGGAAGALQSTAPDLLMFATALADGTLLSADSLAEMEAFVPGEDLSAFGVDHGYGLGLERYATSDITVIGHLGTGEAQSAFVGWDADRGTAIAVQLNTGVAGPQGIIALEALTADAAAA